MSNTVVSEQNDTLKTIQSRFEIIDGWIIYYTPTPHSTLERIRVWLSLFQEHVATLRRQGKEPVLLLNLEEVNTVSNREVRIALTKGLKNSQMKFIAVIGIKNPVMRIIFKFIIKAGTSISSKAFNDKESALEFLNTWSQHSLK